MLTVLGADLVGRAILQQLAARRMIIAEFNGSAPSPPAAERLHLILPAFRERAIVEATLDHFSLLADTGNAEVVVVTQDEGEDWLSTAEAVRAWLSRNPAAKVWHLHQGSTAGSKSSKLNHAVAALRERASADDLPEPIVGVYDFDSRPLPGTLPDVAASFLGADVGIVQQVPLPFGRGLERISVGCKMLAIGHAERAMRIELLHHVHWPLLPVFVRDLRICMGAGLFVRSGILANSGGFPEGCDDIPLGYRMDLLGIRRRTISRPTLVEPVPTLMDAFRGAMRVYVGVFSTFEEVRRRYGTERRLAKYRAALLTHVRDWEVPARPFVLVAGLAAAPNGSLIQGLALVLLALNWAPSTITLSVCKAIRAEAGQEPIRLSFIGWLLAPFFWAGARSLFLSIYLLGLVFPAVTQAALRSKTERLNEGIRE